MHDNWIGQTCRNGHTRTKENTTVTWNATLGHEYLRCDECRRENQRKNYTKKRTSRIDEVLHLLEACAEHKSSAAKVLEISGYSRMDKFYAAMRRRGHHDLAARIREAIKPPPKPAEERYKQGQRYRPYKPKPKVDKTQYMIEDLEMLLPSENIENLLKRLGYSNLTSLRRAVLKADRMDLVQRLDLKNRMENG